MMSLYFILLVFDSTFIIVLGLPIWGIIIVEQIMNFHVNNNYVRETIKKNNKRDCLGFGSRI